MSSLKSNVTGDATTSTVMTSMAARHNENGGTFATIGDRSRTSIMDGPSPITMLTVMWIQTLLCWIGNISTFIVFVKNNKFQTPSNVLLLFLASAQDQTPLNDLIC